MCKQNGIIKCKEDAHQAKPIFNIKCHLVSLSQSECFQQYTDTIVPTLSLFVF